MNKFIGIIPARYASIRFPGKPLVAISGKTMIQRVYEQAQKSKKLNAVIIATDDEKIEEAAKNFGAIVIMTSPHHKSGTDRCFEVAQKLDIAEDSIVINIQGDEPFINPEQIDLVCECFDKKETKIATLIKKIDSFEELQNSSIPKVVINKALQAIYFSRSIVPYFRDIDEKKWHLQHTYYKHIGIYGYQAKTLKEIATIEPSSLEKAESLEQLRWIENGYAIQTAITTNESIAIDHPDDLNKLSAFLK